MKIQPIHFPDYYFLISTCIFLALGSIGIYREVFLVLGITNALIALGYKLLTIGEIKIPKHFILFTVFLGILLIHTYFTHGSFYFFWILFSGGLLWIQTFNFREIFEAYFSQILIILGILMGAIYFYSLKYPIPNLPNLVSLFAAPTSTIKHSDIGDLWAIILTVIFYLFAKKRNILYLPLVLLGGYFLYISFSRTALVALSVGILYIFKNLKQNYRPKRELVILLSGIAILFIYMGMTKTILFSRPYFWHAVAGLVKFPLGTGIGNFSKLNGGSNLVHDIVLEFISGMGIFSIIFIFWLYKILKEIFTSKDTNIEMAAIFLAILVDFCFNTTYTITSFIWMWFISLALI